MLLKVNQTKLSIVNAPSRSGEGIIGMHSVSLSVCPSVTFRVRAITYVCIDGLPSNFGTNVVLIETMCSDLDPDPYLKGQYICITLLKILKTCFFIDVTNQGLIFLFLAKITLTLILPTLHTI